MDKIRNRLPWLGYPTLIFDANLSSTEKMIFVTLWSYADRSGDSCFPGYESLASEAGCSPKTVQRAIKSLETSGLISVNRDSFRSNNYTLTVGTECPQPAGQNDLPSEDILTCDGRSECPPTGSHLTGSHLTGISRTPQRGEEWMEWWNKEIVPLQPKGLLKELRTLGDDRMRKLRTRLKSRSPEEFRREVKAALSKHLRDFALEGAWLSFDWIVKSETNYGKLTENHYEDEEREPEKKSDEITDEDRARWAERQKVLKKRFDEEQRALGRTS